MEWIIGKTSKGRPIFTIAGGAPTVAELEKERDAAVAEGLKFKEVIESGGVLDAEQRSKLRAAVELKKERDRQIAELTGDTDALAELEESDKRSKEEIENRRRNARLPIYGDPNTNPDEAGAFTLGEKISRTAWYEALVKQYPHGLPDGAQYQSEAMLEPKMRHGLGIFTATEKKAMRARAATLLTSADSGAGNIGAAIYPQLLGLIEPGTTRPLFVRQLVTTMPVSTGEGIEYVRETTRGVENILTYVPGATIVPEATALSGTSGLKPGADIDFEKKTAKVVTIAEWIAMTRRAMSDAPWLRAYVDSFLEDDVALALENQILNGDGAGDHFDGLLHDPGIITIDASTFANPYQALAAAQATAQVAGNTQRPISMVWHPFDDAGADTALFGSGGTTFGWMNGGPFANQASGPWGMNDVTSIAMPRHTVLVGDFSRAVLLDREDTNISVGTINDDFLRNIVRVLAEGRWGFFVQRPQAFVKVTNFAFAGFPL
jgi:HK97 family phage major capsid protein